MDALWRIELLGGLRATRGGRVVSRFRTHKTAALLTYLAFYPQRSHPRELLIELLWPECSEEAGRHSLNTALTSLRRQLEPPGVSPGAVIVADRSSAQLQPATVTTDVAAFEIALQAAIRTGSDTERVQRLEEAVALYQGELLPGYFEEWVLMERQRLAEAYLQALGQLIALLAQAHDFPRALYYARHEVAADPLDEERHHALIRLLVAAGQPDAAFRQYHELERLLAQELGVAPAVEIDALIGTLEPRGEGYRDQLPPLSSIPAVTLQPLPAGVVTFLFMEDAAAARDQEGEEAQAAREAHQALLRSEVHRQGGTRYRQRGMLWSQRSRTPPPRCQPPSQG